MTRPETGGLYERTFNVGGVHIDVLAEVEVAGSAVVLRDIVVFPRGTDRAAVGAAALLRAIRAELVPELRSYGFTKAKITGTRVSGATPGRTVEIAIDLTEEEA